MLLKYCYLCEKYKFEDVMGIEHFLSKYLLVIISVYFTGVMSFVSSYSINYVKTRLTLTLTKEIDAGLVENITHTWPI